MSNVKASGTLSVAGRHSPAKQNQSSPAFVNFHFAFGDLVPVNSKKCDAGTSERQRRKTGAVIAIAGTIGGLGGVAINLAFRQSYQSAHTARPALIGFLAFYALCAAVTVLAGRRRTVAAPMPAQAAA